MDVKKLYPSITGKRAGELVYNEVLTTTIEFKNVNYSMGLRYIAKCAKYDSQVAEWGFKGWCPVRTKHMAKRPGMVGDDTEDKKRTSGRVPEDESMRRKIVAKVLQLVVEKIFACNVYTFAGKMRVQKEGAPIGLDLSGEIGRPETMNTDIEFRKLCLANRIKVDVSKRYVDDKNDVMNNIPYGHRWCNDKVMFNEDWIEEDSKSPADAHTCKVMTELANSIHPSIQFVGDVGRNHGDGRIPILDMKMRVIEVVSPEDPVTKTPAFTYPQVSYTFYKKPMARQTIMAASSAMPEKIKRETVVNEMLRCLSNISLGPATPRR